MDWFTLGNMITRIRIGQKASTPGFSRTVIRRPDGLFWVGGIWSGQVVQLRDFLFSDIWTIYDDEETEQWLEFRTKVEQMEREMIVNQYEDLRE
ncbi:hypothetical protein HUB98_22625 [Paenibacillus barcinonensis]|uniref:Uncharacterized protein n=1 Tax=Paenibacillus barcinonensis TaxID=198119 RepID=A0A2V4VUF3_PAEBA|nr:hypothetical protein [Paenibacillus barcinonensis]PYE48563.1 hypothetical protein DFQ00_108155 [Paenibacillus barcinonensis]QKS58738.1 hypothetical protein HUB98_22625 [Paenibacillus barcinonensis]